MKRRIACLLLLVVGVAIALLALGGVSYERHVGYGEVVPSFLANEPRNPEVSIVSSRLTHFGFSGFLALSIEGPPFELQIVGTSPNQRAARSCQLVSLVVRADDTTLLSANQKELPLNVKVQHGLQRAVNGFVFSAPSFLPDTPQRLQIQGTITFPASTGGDTVTFERAFQLHASRRLVVGSFTWDL